uniref:Uncharacterized protein n=1 Tax=Tanacetum cinerariifolium TaxID=118510 RepID=A0A6L2NE31_TANCI|nr:hypothetical protein [Tanacetum cinerariifolium]
MLVQPQVHDVDEIEEDEDDHEKVSHLEQYKVAQALEITKLEGQKVRKQEETQVFWFKKVKEDADEDVTLVNVDADIQGRMEEDVTDVKEVNAAKPTVFDDEEVIMTMAQTLIKMKAEKAKILNEQMDKRLQDEEINQAAARERQEKEDLEKAKVRPIFETEYNKVQTFLKCDKDEEPTKKRHAKDTLLQESFKRLRAEVEGREGIAFDHIVVVSL